MLDELERAIRDSTKDSAREGTMGMVCPETVLELIAGLRLAMGELRVLRKFRDWRLECVQPMDSDEP